MNRSVVKRAMVLLPLLGLVRMTQAGDVTPTRVIAEQGYRVELDLSQQVLLLRMPEDRGQGDTEGSTEASISPP